jgi:hypothetical protein
MEPRRNNRKAQSAMALKQGAKDKKDANIYALAMKKPKTRRGGASAKLAKMRATTPASSTKNMFAHEQTESPTKTRSQLAMVLRPGVSDGRAGVEVCTAIMEPRPGVAGGRAGVKVGVAITESRLGFKVGRASIDVGAAISEPRPEVAGLRAGVKVGAVISEPHPGNAGGAPA